MDAKEIGRFICSLRKDKGLTQSALAELLNISNRTVSKWETGEGLPDISLLPDLAKVLGVTTDEILEGKKAPAEKSADIKVEEVANKDNLLNLFKIAFVISLFFAIFGMLLGTITELYCIWAFNILFYTHWEIMFVAVSLVAVVAAGLVFSVGVTRLSVVSVIFPLSFIARIIELSRFGYYTLPIMLVIIAALVFAGVKLYGKIR